MLNDITVDILMATYNGEKYIEQQIDSILNQTYVNFNLIISDDCSSDKTLKIIKKYEQKDKRIKVYQQQKNLGYRKNFEFLCNKISSKYIMFSDQDDVWLQDKIEKMLDYIKVKNSALVYCDLDIVDKNLKSINNTMLRQSNMYDKAKKYNDFNLLKFENAVTGCAMITTEEIVKNALPFPKKFFPHDWWIGLIATQYGTVDFLDIPLVKYRQHDANCIGALSLKQKYSNFDDYYNQRIQYRINQFEILSQRKNMFNDETKKNIELGNTYFNNPKISNINKLWVLMAKEKKIKRIKWIILFSFPKIAKFFWKG